jgi:hypothetical protein
MIKSLVSILISLGLTLAGSFYEIYYVKTTFSAFRSTLLSLYDKSESHLATYEDGRAIQTFWEEKKKILYILLPHTLIDQVDYHLGEALGYLYQGNFEDSLPKFELLLDMAETIPRAYRILPENIF